MARASSIRDSLDSVRLDLILPGDVKARTRGIARAEELLASYGLPGDVHWMDRPEAKRLPDHDRVTLAADLVSFCFWSPGRSGRRGSPKRPAEREAAVADALRINNAARSCFPATSVPALLERQASEMVAAPAASPEVNRTPSTRELFLDAAVAVRNAKYAAAIPLLERVVKEQPNHAVAQFCLAYCKEQLGRHDQALERICGGAVA